MGFFSKVFKGAKKAVRKVAKVAFKPINALVVDPLKKVWENKWGRMLLIGGAVIGGGIALSGMMAGAGGAGAAGATAGSTAGAAGSSAVGTAGATAGTAGAGSGLGATYSAGLTSAAPASMGTGGAIANGAINTATLTSNSIAPTILSGGNAAASKGLLSSVGQWAAANPTLAMAGASTGGQMLSGYMQGRSAEKQAERDRAQMIADRNSRSAYGITYDGSENAGIDTGGLLSSAMANYQPGQAPTPYQAPLPPGYDWQAREQQRRLQEMQS